MPPTTMMMKTTPPAAAAIITIEPSSSEAASPGFAADTCGASERSVHGSASSRVPLGMARSTVEAGCVCNGRGKRLRKDCVWGLRKGLRKGLRVQGSGGSSRQHTVGAETAVTVVPVSWLSCVAVTAPSCVVIAVAAAALLTRISAVTRMDADATVSVMSSAETKLRGLRVPKDQVRSEAVGRDEAEQIASVKAIRRNQAQSESEAPERAGEALLVAQLRGIAEVGNLTRDRRSVTDDARLRVRVARGRAWKVSTVGKSADGRGRAWKGVEGWQARRRAAWRRRRAPARAAAATAVPWRLDNKFPRPRRPRIRRASSVRSRRASPAREITVRSR